MGKSYLKRALTRVKFWKAILSTKDTNYTFGELMAHAFSLTGRARCRNRIERIEREGKFNIYYLKNVERPVYFPHDSINFPEYRLFLMFDEQLWDKSWHQYHPLQIPQMQLKQDDIVLDCGAAEGIYPLLYHNCCKKIYCIEPLPIFVESLEMTFKGVDNVVVLPIGLSSKPGKAEIEQCEFSTKVLESGNGSIPIETIDSLFYEKDQRVDIIKSDVEGHALKTLEGAKETLKTYKPKLAIACYHYKDEYKELKDFINSLGLKYHIHSRGITLCADGQGGSPELLLAWPENE